MYLTGISQGMLCNKYISTLCRQVQTVQLCFTMCLVFSLSLWEQGCVAPPWYSTGTKLSYIWRLVMSACVCLFGVSLSRRVELQKGYKISLGFHCKLLERLMNSSRVLCGCLLQGCLWLYRTGTHTFFAQKNETVVFSGGFFSLVEWTRWFGEEECSSAVAWVSAKACSTELLSVVVCHRLHRQRKFFF